MNGLNRSLPYFLAAGLLTGCATASPAGDADRGSRTQNVLDAAEIGGAGSFYNAHDAVRSLRPAWLRQRSRSLTNPRNALVSVYLDGVHIGGGGAALAQVRVEDIARMEFMSPSDATTRFGTGHFGGAILITTHRG